jgi:cell wall assembly regulator SMI1
MIDTPRLLQLIRRLLPTSAVVPRGVSDSDCDEFEQRTGIALPNDFREWLKVSNGPEVGPSGMFGIGTPTDFLDIESILDIHPGWKSKKWIPVASDACGNYYLVATQQEFGRGYPVFFVEATSGSDSPQYIVASDIGHFVIALLEQELADIDLPFERLDGLSFEELTAPGSPFKELSEHRWPFDENRVMQTDPHIVDFPGLTLPWMPD